jgi:transcription antitermination factor NusG
LPLQTTLRQWSDRKKKVTAPLFNSYIFVFAFEHDIARILTIPGMAWNIRHEGKPAVLSDHELELIRRFLSTGLFVETSAIDPDEMRLGDRVQVIDGPLAGVKGFVTSDDGSQRLLVEIESIHQVIRVQIPAYLLKKT